MGRDSERGYRGSCRVVWYIDVMLLCFRMTFDSSLEGQQWVETLREAIEEAVELCGILTLCCYVSE